MTAALSRRLRKLENGLRIRPELGNLSQLPGETWEALERRAEAWRAENPAARRGTIRLVGIRDELGSL